MLDFIITEGVVLNHHLIKRKSSIFIPKIIQNTIYTDGRVLAAALNKNIESLGFIFSKDLLDEISFYFSNTTIETVETFSNELVAILSHLVGADVKYVPFYANFPKYVMESADLHLYVNSLLHY